MSDNHDILKEDLTQAYSYPAELNQLTTNLEKRIKKERRRKSTLYGSLSVMAASLFFILLVNTSTSFAYALSDIPILNRISQMVIFDESLKSAIDNELIQYVGLKDINEEKVLKLPYVIADERNLVLFFQTDDSSLELGESYEVELNSVRDIATGELFSEGFISTSFMTTNNPAEDLGLIQVGNLFVDVPLPQHIDISVTLIRSKFVEGEYIRIYEKTFKYTLKLKDFEKPKIYSIDKEYTFEGVRLTFDKIQAYPTGTEIHYTTSKENEDEFSPQFDLLEDGRQFPLSYNWIHQKYFEEYHEHVLRIDNNLFSEPSSRTLILRGYNYLKESEQYISLDVEEEVLSRPIENMELLNVSQQKETTTLVFRAESSTSEPPIIFFQDEKGNQLNIKSFRHTTHSENASYVYEVETNAIPTINIRIYPPYTDLGENSIKIPLTLPIEN